MLNIEFIRLRAVDDNMSAHRPLDYCGKPIKPKLNQWIPHRFQSDSPNILSLFTLNPQPGLPV